MAADEAVVLLVTAGDAAEAERVATALLDARLVACVNRIDGVHSRYWWQGAVEQATESLLVAKTRRSLVPRAVAAIRAVHSYEVFEAIALPIVAANPDYLQWIFDSTEGA